MEVIRAAFLSFDQCKVFASTQSSGAILVYLFNSVMCIMAVYSFAKADWVIHEIQVKWLNIILTNPPEQSSDDPEEAFVMRTVDARSRVKLVHPPDTRGSQEWIDHIVKCVAGRYPIDVGGDDGDSFVDLPPRWLIKRHGCLLGGLMGDVDCGTVANTPHHQSYLTLTKRQDGLVVPTLVRPELTHVQKFVFPDREKDEAQLAQLRYSRCGPLCSSVFSSLSY